MTDPRYIPPSDRGDYYLDQRWPDDTPPERGGRTPWHHWLLAVLVGLLGAVLYVIAAGCGASPSGIEGAQVETAYGTVTAIGLPADAVRDGVERGYDAVAAQGYTLRATGLTVIASTATDYHGAYWPDRDVVELVDVAALPHEIGHRAAHQLGRGAECCRLQGHRPGYDLGCREVN